MICVLRRTCVEDGMLQASANVQDSKLQGPVTRKVICSLWQYFEHCTSFKRREISSTAWLGLVQTNGLQ